MTIKDVTKEWLEEEYKTKSFVQIAKELGTYTMKVMRLARKFGIVSRSHSDAQSRYLLKTDNHPTRGKKRSEETRNKISRNHVITYIMGGEEKRKARQKLSKEIWDKKTNEEKREMCRKAILGTHKAAKEGSKLEKYLMKKLTIAGYKAEYHKEQVLPSGRMHLDIVLPELHTVIEVNGVAHYKPVWGDDVLKSTQASDKEKQGLLLVAGFTFIEIADHSDKISQAQMADIWDQLKTVLLKISTTHLHYHERYIVIQTRFNDPTKMEEINKKEDSKKNKNKKQNQTNKTNKPIDTKDSE